MTETAFADKMKAEEGQFDVWSPDNTAPLVAWLVSEASAGVSGEVFELMGGMIRLCLGWGDGPEFDKGARWEPAEIGAKIGELLKDRPAAKPVWGSQ
jgi:hypothetical protein